MIKIQHDGLAYAKKGDYASARRCFDEAIRVDPKSWSAYYSRARLDYRESKWQQTIEDASAALRFNSSFAGASISRADANGKLGRYDAAVREYDHVISLGRFGSEYAVALNDSAWIRSTCQDARYRNGQLALSQAALACRVTWDRNPKCLDTLAAANAELGNFEAAIRVEQMALALRAPAEDIKEFQQHMASFKQHRPWRDVSK